jgi:RimJ/RimL family protein N-acetyltransferase
LDLRPFSYARRVVTLATRFAFDRLDIARMEIYVEIDNRASNAVAASAGFVREGVLRSQSTVAGRRRDMALYARLAGGHGEVR